VLHDVAHLVRTHFDNRASRHGATRSQWLVLARLERQPGLSQKELSVILEVEPISVARLVDRLEVRGLVERRPDPQDRRIWRLYNLPAARATLDNIARYREALNGEVAKAVSPAALEALTNTLLIIRNRLINRREI
jgi:DNA-binding MarR family transcriptional regulator